MSSFVMKIYVGYLKISFFIHKNLFIILSIYTLRNTRWAKSRYTVYSIINYSIPTFGPLCILT